MHIIGTMIFEVCVPSAHSSILAGRKVGNRGRKSDKHSIKQHAGRLYNALQNYFQKVCPCWLIEVSMLGQTSRKFHVFFCLVGLVKSGQFPPSLWFVPENVSTLCIMIEISSQVQTSKAGLLADFASYTSAQQFLLKYYLNLVYNFTCAGFLGDQKKLKEVQCINKESNIIQLVSGRQCFQILLVVFLCMDKLFFQNVMRAYIFVHLLVFFYLPISSTFCVCHY